MLHLSIIMSITDVFFLISHFSKILLHLTGYLHYWFQNFDYVVGKMRWSKKERLLAVGHLQAGKSAAQTAQNFDVHEHNILDTSNKIMQNRGHFVTVQGPDVDVKPRVVRTDKSFWLIYAGVLKSQTRLQEKHPDKLHKAR